MTFIKPIPQSNFYAVIFSSTKSDDLQGSIGIVWDLVILFINVFSFRTYFLPLDAKEAKSQAR